MFDFKKASVAVAAGAAAIVALATPAAAQFDRPGGGRWVRCAQEDGYCRVPYPTIVRYGANNNVVERRVNGGGIACNNRTFGDPAYGIRKICLFLARDDGPPSPPRGDWARCAVEGGYCSVPYPTRVRYGAGSNYFERNVGPRGIECSNRAFGDPFVGIVKNCSYMRRY